MRYPILNRITGNDKRTIFAQVLVFINDCSLVTARYLEGLVRFGPWMGPLEEVGFSQERHPFEKGKPVERPGRKATELRAGYPDSSC